LHHTNRLLGGSGRGLRGAEQLTRSGGQIVDEKVVLADVLQM